MKREINQKKKNLVFQRKESLKKLLRTKQLKKNWIVYKPINFKEYSYHRTPKGLDSQWGP